MLTKGLKDLPTDIAEGRSRRSSSNAHRGELDHPVFRADPNEKPRQLLLSFAVIAFVVYFGWSSSRIESDKDAFRLSVSFVFVAFQVRCVRSEVDAP